MRSRPPERNHGAVTIAAVTADPAAGRPTLYRRSSHRLLGGVAGGIADHLRVPVVAIRLVFVLLSFAGGVGALLYCVYWIVVPTAPGTVTGKRAMLLEYGAAVVGLRGCGRLCAAGHAARVAVRAGRPRLRRRSADLAAGVGIAAATVVAAVAEFAVGPSRDRLGRARLVAGASFVAIGAIAVLARHNLTRCATGWSASSSPPSASP